MSTLGRVSSVIAQAVESSGGRCQTKSLLDRVGSTSVEPMWCASEGEL
jgi:hypothetical protein